MFLRRSDRLTAVGLALALCWIVVPPTRAVGQEYRSWTSADGKFKTEARLVLVNEVQVVLEKRSRELVTVPLANLSQADRQFLEAARPGSKPAAAAANNAPDESPPPATADDVIKWLSEPNQPPQFDLVRRFETPGTAIRAVAISGHGTHVVSVAASGEARIWELKTGKELDGIGGVIAGKVQCVALSHDGDYCVAGCEDGTIHVLDTAERKLVAGGAKGTAPIVQITMVGDGRNYIAVDQAGTLQIRYAGKSDPKREGTVPLEINGVHQAATTRSGFTAMLRPNESNIIGTFLPGPIFKEGTAVTMVMSSLPRFIAAHQKLLVVATEDHKIVIHALPTVQRPEFELQRAGSVPMRIPGIAHLAISYDGAWITCVSQSGGVEILRVATPEEPCAGRFNANGLQCVAISPDARMIAVGQKDGFTNVLRLKQRPDRGLWRLERFIRGCLEQENYQLLEEVARQIAADPEPFHWSPAESKMSALLDYCAGDPQGLPALEHRDALYRKWRKQQPDSVIAKLSEVDSLHSAAWRARGGGFADTVTPEGWAGFRKGLDKAEALLMPLMERPDVPLEAYSQLLAIAKGQSWDEDKLKTYLEQLQAKGPDYFDAHARRVEMLMPRWGGDIDDSQQYARQVADRVGGERGDILYARLVACLCRYYSPQSFIDETHFDYERAQRGMEILASRKPADWHMVSVGLRLAWGQNDGPRGAKFLKQLREIGRAGVDPTWDTAAWVSYIQLQDATIWAQEQ